MKSIQKLESYICSYIDTKNQLDEYALRKNKELFIKKKEPKSIKEIEIRKTQIKKAFLECIGGIPVSDVPLNAKTINIIQGKQYKIEKVIFQSRAYQYVTGNLYLPIGIKEPRPTILFVSGHEYLAKHSEYYHRICIKFVRAGFNVFAIDPLGQGERISNVSFQGREKEIWGTMEHQYFGIKCHLLGESVARYFLHDNMRAIDYLYTRSEVDQERIAVTGNSGGGTQTAMLMICEDRISAAAPATYITSRKSLLKSAGVQDAEQVWYGFNQYGFEYEDILIAFAPKPLIVLSTTYDFFPIEGTRETVSEAKKTWELYRAENKFKYIEDASVHKYTDNLVREAINFFKEHIGSRTETISDNFDGYINPGKLKCTVTGQVITEYRDAKTLQWELDKTVKRLKSERYRYNEEKWLREKIFSNRYPTPYNERIIPFENIDGMKVNYIFWWSQENLINSAFTFEQENSNVQEVVIGLWRGGTNSLSKHWDWIADEVSSGKKVLVVNLSGVGPHEPNKLHQRNNSLLFGALHKITDQLFWIGDSLAALRIYDLTRCINLVRKLEKEKVRISIYSSDLYSIYGKLINRIDNNIQYIQTQKQQKTIENIILDHDLNENELMSIVLPGIYKYLEI